MYIRNLFKHWSYRLFAPGLLLREKYEAFRDLLEQDKNSHELIAELQQIYYDQVKCDYCAITEKCDRLSHCVSKVIRCLAKLCPTKYIHLMDYFNKIDFYIKLAISLDETDFSPPFVISLDDVQAGDHRLVGGKAYTLSEIRKELHMPTVDGFVITTNAFNYFLEANDLRKEINKRLAALDVRSVNSVRSAAQALQQLIEESVVPEAIESEIKHALPTLQDNSGAEQRFAVRSSALGEDRQGSYAGQYKTILNVATESVVDAYKTVIASKYSNRALTYRIYRGETDQETPMAALVLPMINARVSGLIYTDDPNETAANITIRCAWGLGKAIVDGSIAPSTIAVGKMPPHQILRRDTSRQQSKAALKPEGGVAMISTGEESCAYAAINDQIIRELAGWALKLEKFYQTPQDIEWCLDFQDNLIFLQSRKLSLETQAPEAANCEEFASQTPLLLSGGERASGGIASGIVHNLEQNPSLEDIPEGTVLVTSVPHPDLVVVFSKIKALVSDLGSSAGHLASVAREFGIPGLVNTGSATRVLETGMVVTVNANSCKVHQGKAGKLIECVRNWSGTIPETPLNSKLAKALQYIAPLNLVDSEADNFAPETCKTFHDILRFSHEKAVLEMFSLGWTGSRRAGGAKRLMSDIPIVVYVLDLGGGIEGHQNDEKEVRIEAVQCVPMQALWRGLSHPDIKWNANVIHFNWGEFDRLSRGIVQPNSKNLGSYAIFSDDYLNFHIHFGYHFVVLDTLCTENADSNYILLRFAGGGGIIKSRLLRVQFLSDILSRAGFKIDQKGDMLDVQLTRCERAKLEDLLQMIGQLLGCTRLLDLVLEDSSQVEEMVHRFISGDFDLSPSARN